MIQRALGAADVARYVAVAGGLCRLTAEGVDLPVHLAHHIVQAQQVGFCGAQALLGLFAAGVEPADTGGFFQNCAAVFGLGVDQGTDHALGDEGR